MLIGVIADTHGNLAGWQRAWELGLRDADLIIHCGDLLYHGPKFAPVEAYAPKALAEAINGCGKPVVVAKGNGDSEVDQLVLEVPIQQPYALVVVEDQRLLVTHGHLLTPEELAAVAEKWDLAFLLTGHTHIPTCRRLGPAVHLNPGTVTYPLSPDPQLRRPTFALIRDGRPEVIDLSTGQRLLSAPD
jgi:putative phosphoesterase